jgi:branched-chain amino acid transport system substrate-binding protein
VPMLAAAEQQNLGKRIRFVSSAPAYSIDVPKAIGAYWNKNFAVNLEFNPLESKGADNLNWLAVMNSHGAKSDPRDTFSQAGYLAARLVTETLLKMDPAKIDRDAVTTALRKVDSFRSDILCKPFYVGAGNRHNANNAGPMMLVDGGGFSMASSGCLTAEDPELVDVRADEKKLGLK